MPPGAQSSQAGVNRKSDASPVTIADYGAQALLCRAIRRHFPDEGIIAEEGGQDFLSVPLAERELAVRLVGQLLGERVLEDELVRWLEHGRGVRSDRTWVIDPIDGTEGFIHRRSYAVCVGTRVEGEPVDGIIGVPVSPLDEGGTLFYSDGGSAWAEPLEGGEPRALHVSDRRGPREHPRGGELHHGPALAGGRRPGVRGGGHRRAAAQALRRHAQVRAGGGGRGGAVHPLGPGTSRRTRTKIWDHVAGTALVKAAGGEVTRLDGHAVDFSQAPELRGTLGLIASNGRIHRLIVDAMGKAAGTRWGFLSQPD